MANILAQMNSLRAGPDLQQGTLCTGTGALSSQWPSKGPPPKYLKVFKGLRPLTGPVHMGPWKPKSGPEHSQGL